jgi:hypothetical protein
MLNPSAGPASGPSSLNPSLRSASPFEQPYSSAGAGAAPQAGPSRFAAGYGSGSGSGNVSGRGTPDYSDYLGAPKKENGQSGSALGGGSWGSYAQQRTAEDLEEGNDVRIEGLSAKVKMLKDVSSGMT